MCDKFLLGYVGEFVVISFRSHDGQVKNSMAYMLHVDPGPT